MSDSGFNPILDIPAAAVINWGEDEKVKPGQAYHTQQLNVNGVIKTVLVPVAIANTNDLLGSSNDVNTDLEGHGVTTSNRDTSKDNAKNSGSGSSKETAINVNDDDGPPLQSTVTVHTLQDVSTVRNTRDASPNHGSPNQTERIASISNYISKYQNQPAKHPERASEIPSTQLQDNRIPLLQPFNTNTAGKSTVTVKSFNKSVTQMMTGKTVLPVPVALLSQANTGCISSLSGGGGVFGVNSKSSEKQTNSGNPAPLCVTISNQPTPVVPFASRLPTVLTAFNDSGLNSGNHVFAVPVSANTAIQQPGHQISSSSSSGGVNNTQQKFIVMTGSGKMLGITNAGHLPQSKTIQWPKQHVNIPQQLSSRPGPATQKTTILTSLPANPSQQTFVLPSRPVGASQQAVVLTNQPVATPPQQVLSISKPMAPAQQAVVLPPQQITTPQQQTLLLHTQQGTIPQQTVAVPPQPLTTPQQTVILPQQPLTTPQQTVILPQQPLTTPQQTVILPQPLTTPQQTVILPQQPVILPQQTLTTPQQTVVLSPVEPASQIPSQPVSQAEQDVDIKPSISKLPSKHMVALSPQQIVKARPVLHSTANLASKVINTGNVENPATHTGALTVNRAVIQIGIRLNNSVLPNSNSVFVSHNNKSGQAPPTLTVPPAPKRVRGPQPLSRAPPPLTRGDSRPRSGIQSEGMLKLGADGELINSDEKLPGNENIVKGTKLRQILPKNDYSVTEANPRPIVPESNMPMVYMIPTSHPMNQTDEENSKIELPSNGNGEIKEELEDGTIQIPVDLKPEMTDEETDSVASDDTVCYDHDDPTDMDYSPSKQISSPKRSSGVRKRPSRQFLNKKLGCVRLTPSSAKKLSQCKPCRVDCVNITLRQRFVEVKSDLVVRVVLGFFPPHLSNDLSLMACGTCRKQVERFWNCKPFKVHRKQWELIMANGGCLSKPRKQKPKSRRFGKFNMTL